NKSILKQSELFINTLSQRIAADQMRFAQDELARATASLSGIKVEMLDYQNEHGVLDPLLQAEATSRLINELQGQLAAQETELKNQLTYLKDNTPQVVALRNNINALKSQITIEQDKVASPKGKKLNQMVADYEELKAKYQFSTDLYKLSIASVEKARIDAARKLKSLAVIASPQLPEESQYPTRLYWLFTVLLCSGLMYGVARLIIAIIEDHRD
ncbi:MAG: capsule biosynthesis protein, partial [Plesiomonas sp.]